MRGIGKEKGRRGEGTIGIEKGGDMTVIESFGTLF